MKILGIETTCDETAAGIVENGKKILRNIVSSSVDFQKKFGGVVPEIAAREQVKSIIPVLEECLLDFDVRHIDAISVAYGPGLAGSLLVGVESAKALAVSWDKPLIAVNHLFGHVYSNWLGGETLPEFPLVALIISGGHTDLILVKNHKDFRWLGGTLDDACGEAFDKVAKILDLSYPGGPEIEELALGQKTKTGIFFPRPMISSDNFDFSFSGLKTAVASYIAESKMTFELRRKIAFAFQESISDVLIAKTLRASQKFKVSSVVLGGGVTANNYLRRRFSDTFEKEQINVHFPLNGLSVDNGSMIAAAAYYQRNFVDPIKLSAEPGLYFE